MMQKKIYSFIRHSCVRGHRGCECLFRREKLPHSSNKYKSAQLPGKSLKDYCISLQLSRLDVFRGINNDLAPLCCPEKFGKEKDKHRHFYSDMDTRIPNIGHVPELTFCGVSGEQSYGGN